MTHPPPRAIAIAHCLACGRVRFARHVNRENQIPVRYCARCGTPVAIAIYRYEREVPR